MRTILPLSDEMALFDAIHSRALEQREASTAAAYPMMCRAGEAVARLALACAPHAKSIWIAAGPGNNGGDGLEAALHLLRFGKDIEVSLIDDTGTRPADSRAALARAQAAGVRIDSHATRPSGTPQLAIDALLGAGANRAPQGAIAAAIRELNAGAFPVLAIDLPSGLHPDTGEPLGDDCVRATHTLAMLTLKPGLFTGVGRDHTGQVWLETLGVDVTNDVPQAWLSGMTSEARLPSRSHAQHKGSFGDVAIVGGALGMSGAALLAARAAHAAGAGRVYVELLDHTPTAATLDPSRPELMFRSDWSRGAPELLARTTVACGCGGGDAVRAPLPRLLSLAQRLVLDADALNALAADATLSALVRARAARGLPTVLTPHPLEAARLLACTTREVQADRLAAARELADRFACVVVLKGSGSVIAAPHQIPRVNSTGNAALASGGTGDVLAGWLAGRWAQQGPGDDAATAFSVARRAVAEHGAAADSPSSDALRAVDLIERLHRL